MAEFVLAENGAAVARIAVRADADPAVHHAARELQHHLKLMSGAELPIMSPELAAAAIPRAPIVHVGVSPAVMRASPTTPWAQLGEDGTVVRSINGGLVVAGAAPRGTLYSVYDFLERDLGVRWLAPDATHIPKRSRVAVNTLDRAHRPAFRYREVHAQRHARSQWTARNKLNGAFYDLDERQGGKMAYAGFVHTFYPLLPPEEFFARHPEYYSEIKGQRIGSHGQLCLTNPEVIDLVTQRVADLIRRTPGARVASVSQNDWGNWCTCANCRAIDEREGSPAGTLVRFVNAVAERLESDFPQMLFDTLAYTYGLEAPRSVVPRPNVVMRLCHITPCCDTHPLDRCDINTPFLSHLRAWGEISPEVWVWDYWTNFHHYFMPMPSIDAIDADLALMADAGVTGMFCQSDGEPTKGCGDLGELKAYLMAKLLWDPDLDGWTVVDDFVQHYYGDAATPIREYLDLMHEWARRPEVHAHLYSRPTEQPFLDDEYLRVVSTLFDDAARRARFDPAVGNRVAAARLSVQYVQWRRGLRHERRGLRYEPADAALTQSARTFFEVAERNGVGALREGGRPLKVDAAALAGCDLHVMSNGMVELAIAPALGGRFINLRNLRRDGEEWLSAGQPMDPDYPCSGGYEEYSGERWHEPGWADAYTLTGDAMRATLTARLSNGMELRRVLALDPTRPVLRIESTLTNVSDQARIALLRTHPEFSVSDFADAAVRARNEGGGWRDVPLWRSADAAPQGDAWLGGDALPWGAVALRRGQSEIMLEFDRDATDRLLCGWDRGANVVRLECFGKPVKLAPGAATVLKQTWTIYPI